jgi:hypothetical protein
MSLLPVVIFRDPFPPHTAFLQVHPVEKSLRYGFPLMRMATATFRVSRSDPNVAKFVDKIQTAMVTIQRDDKLWPFVGFVTKYTAPRKDPEVELGVSDHVWLLARARTRLSGFASGASGTVLASALADMKARAEPPLNFELAFSAGGGLADWEFKPDEGLDFLKRLSSATGWEWAFIHEITDDGVRTVLDWREFIGQDRRVEVVWEESKHLADVTYSFDAKGFAAAGVAVGGSPSLAVRPAAVQSQSGTSNDGTPTRKLDRAAWAQASPALMGTRITREPQVTNQETLFAAAANLRESPQHVARQLSLSIHEGAVEMDRFGVGDIVTVRLADTDLGMPLQVPARLLAINMRPDSGVHEVEAQVVEEA